MKKLLIAGGSHSDIPLIKAAQELGYFVITSGNRADDKGHKYSNQTFLVDFSDQEAMLSLARSLKIDAICSSSNDFSVISSSYVAENMGLPGFDNYYTTLQLHLKDNFRGLAKKLSLSCPRALDFDSFVSEHINLDGIRFPLIVKPVDLTGGKGISKVENQAELKIAIKIALSVSRLGRIVIEEFFDGTLHSYSTIIKNQKVIFDYADNEFSFLNPYLVSTSTSPARVSKLILNNLRSETEKLAKYLNLTDGILHGQFLVKNDEFRIIEYTRRMPGDFYSIPVKMSTGFDHAKAVIQQSLGMFVDVTGDFRQKKFVSRHCAMAARSGVISHLDVAEEIKDKIVDCFNLREAGDSIVNPLLDKAAIFFLQYETAEEMDRLNKLINQLIRVQVR